MLAISQPPFSLIRHTWWREARHTHRRHAHARHSTHWASRKSSSQVLLEQRICLSFRVVGVGDTVDDLLGLVARYLFVVGLDVAEVVAAVVMRLPNAHTVVCEVNIAVVAEELGHRGRIGDSSLRCWVLVFEDLVVKLRAG